MIFSMILPAIIFVVWGSFLASSKSFSYQSGIGVGLFGLFVLFLQIGFLSWKDNDWLLNNQSVLYFIWATACIVLYFFIFIFLPSNYSYNGTTAIFMAFNFVFSTLMTYMKNDHKFIKIETFYD